MNIQKKEKNEEQIKQGLLKAFNNDKSFKIDGVILSNDIGIIKQDEVPDAMTFENCSFKRFSILGQKGLNSVTFINCFFESIYISGCSIRNQFIIDNECNVSKSIEFWHSKIQTIDIHNSNVNRGEVKCFDVDADRISIMNVKCRAINLQEKTKVKGQLIIQDLQIDDSLIFSDINLSGDTALHNVTIKKDFIIVNSTFSDDVLIYGLNLNGFLNVERSEFTEQVFFEFDRVNSRTINFNSIFIGISKFEKGFYFKGLIDNSYLKIKSIELVFNTESKGEVNFGDIDVEDIIITGTNKNAEIILRSSKVERLKIHGLINYSNLKLFKISPSNNNSVISIKDTILGECDLFNINLKKFDRVIIENSQILNIIPVNVTWPRKVYSNKKNSNYEGSDFRKERENYRQLKEMVRKNGDKVQALRFESNEWEAYKSYLNTSHKGLLNRTGDKFILWTNASNDYGLNWIKPLVLLLLSTLVFYSIIIFCLYEPFPLSQLNSKFYFQGLWNNWCSDFWLYFHFLNPVHNLKHFLPELQFKSWGMFWDVLMRLFAGYFIFQMVRAFRKYTR